VHLQFSKVGAYVCRGFITIVQCRPILLCLVYITGQFEIKIKLAHNQIGF